VVKTLVLAVVFASQLASAPKTIVPPAPVQERVKPILDLCEKAQGAGVERHNAAFYQIDEMTGELFRMKTKSSDEALVVLMSFYIGESTGEDLLHEITVRGKRMLPLLLKYSNATVIFSRKKYPSSLLLAPDVKKESFDDTIENIRAGKVIGVD
jgi:hypothetical protein